MRRCATDHDLHAIEKILMLSGTSDEKFSIGSEVAVHAVLLFLLGHLCISFGCGDRMPFSTLLREPLPPTFQNVSTPSTPSGVYRYLSNELEAAVRPASAYDRFAPSIPATPVSLSNA